jgi:hypothetical protein
MTERVLKLSPEDFALLRRMLKAFGDVLAGATWTDEQVAEFGERFEALVAKGGALRVIPQQAPLTPDEIRSLLRECVTVVKPGEILVIRVPFGGITANQHREYAEHLEYYAEQHGIRAMIVLGDELGVQEAAQ